MAKAPDKRSDKGSDNDQPDPSTVALIAPMPSDPKEARSANLLPPQGEGVPHRLYSTGSPQSRQRLGAALLALRDPVARNSFSRPYSGQSRIWAR